MIRNDKWATWAHLDQSRCLPLGLLVVEADERETTHSLSVIEGAVRGRTRRSEVEQLDPFGLDGGSRQKQQ